MSPTTPGESPMLRNILATLGGFFLGSCVNMALITLNSSVLYPMPPGTDMNDPAAFEAYISGLPMPAFSWFWPHTWVSPLWVPGSPPASPPPGGWSRR